jgi:hypothetical protein
MFLNYYIFNIYYLKKRRMIIKDFYKTRYISAYLII